jgi:hypothetical protein
MTAGAQDVGGTNNLRLTANLAIHGGRAGDARYMEDGLTIRNIGAAGAFTNLFPDEGATQEVAIDFASGSSEMMTSGVGVNYIPKEGGNTLKGSFFGTGVNSSFQSSNFTQDLQDRGLRTPNSLKEYYDLNGSAGGPILRDKIWFFASARRQVGENYIAGLYYNLNAGDPTKWTYSPDLGRQAYIYTIQPSASGRVTWQASPKNKFSFFYDHQPRDYTTTTATSSPESASEFVIDSGRIIALGWTSPVTSRVLVEAQLATHTENLHNGAWPENPNDPYLGGARLNHLRHGRARLQGRVRRRLGRAGPARARHRFGHELPVQQRHPQPDHDAGVAGDALGRHAGRARHLCAGSVDDSAPDAERRRPVRLLQDVFPRRAPRARNARPDAQLHDSRV